jgi:hypothetical protein
MMVLPKCYLAPTSNCGDYLCDNEGLTSSTGPYDGQFATTLTLLIYVRPSLTSTGSKLCSICPDSDDQCRHQAVRT